MIDFYGICNGLAGRFAPGTIATPTGASAMRAASGQMPKSVPVGPAVFVEALDGTVVADNGGIWQHEMNVDVVFLLSKRPGDPVRVEAQRQRWLPTLLAATEGKMKIGIGAQTGYTVDKAIPRGWAWAEERVGDVDYDAIRIHYRIYVSELVNGTGVLIP